MRQTPIIRVTSNNRQRGFSPAYPRPTQADGHVEYCQPGTRVLPTYYPAPRMTSDSRRPQIRGYFPAKRHDFGPGAGVVAHRFPRHGPGLGRSVLFGRRPRAANKHLTEAAFLKFPAALFRPRRFCATSHRGNGRGVHKCGPASPNSPGPLAQTVVTVTGALACQAQRSSRA